MKIFYLSLEPYRERYTEMLTKWTIDRWSNKPGVELIHVQGERIPQANGIQAGSVLDAHGRSYWSLTQMAEMARMLRDEEITYQDAIYLDDMFTPGYEALPYILDQHRSGRVPQIWARNHAQSVDPDDFTFSMRSWMRHYEHMVYNTSGIICASSAHRELMEVAMLNATNTHVLGLPYDEDDVRARGPSVVLPLDQRPKQVIYCSRFDNEKQPHFFMDVVEAFCARQGYHCDTQFVLTTGGDEVRSSDRSALQRLERLERDGLIRVKRGCTKQEYYAELASSRVQLNTARQDFISYTAIEASTFGTPTLAPAFRAFPEALRNRQEQMFVPWSVEDAVQKLLNLLHGTAVVPHVGWLSRTQHKTLDRILAVMSGDWPTDGPWWKESICD